MYFFQSVGFAAGVVLLGAVLRLHGSFSELWLDEIWSLYNLQGLTTPWKILSTLNSDNNHPLNSLWFFLLGPDREFFMYRLPSLGAGILTPWLVWLLTSSWKRSEQILATFFVSFSYLFVLYGSEGRGYSTMILAVLGSLLALQQGERDSGWRWPIVFWICAVLGALSHLSFLLFYLGIFISSFCFERGRLLKFHLIPAVLLGFYVLHFARHVSEGSGPIRPYIEVVIEALSVALGGRELSAIRPAESLSMCLVALMLMIVIASEIRNLWSTDRKLSVQFLLQIVVIPAFVIVAFQPRVLFVRYFLISILFLYLLLARFLVRISAWEMGHVFAVVLVLFFTAGNGWYQLRFWRFGRGEYREALQYIADHAAPDGALKIGGDHDFRTSMLLSYYQRFLAPQRQIRWMPSSGPAPEWYISHSLDPRVEPPLKIEAGYRLEASFPHGAISGFRWNLYRRKDPS